MGAFGERAAEDTNRGPEGRPGMLGCSLPCQRASECEMWRSFRPKNTIPAPLAVLYMSTQYHVRPSVLLHPPTSAISRQPGRQNTSIGTPEPGPLHHPPLVPASVGPAPSHETFSNAPKPRGRHAPPGNGRAGDANLWDGHGRAGPGPPLAFKRAGILPRSRHCPRDSARG